MTLFLAMLLPTKLFDLVKVKKVCDGAPRSFSDYTVTMDKDKLPTDVTVEELI